MSITHAKSQIDLVINKARIHLYKPIQIAEILHRKRIYKNIDLSSLEMYRTSSRKWRDDICIKFLGRTSTSSARFQDNLFDKNAIPPCVLVTLDQYNTNGEVEAYIYNAFKERHFQMINGLDLVKKSNKKTFQLNQFIESFRRNSGLSRSVDKIFEIIVYAIFSTLLDNLNAKIKISIANKENEVLKEFSDFTEKILGLTHERSELIDSPRVYRVGVTNAADRGVDMWANFGLAIQIKHLSLTSKNTDDITAGISADRIVIVCRDCDKSILLTVLRQFGQGGRIQAVITEDELIKWYEKALRGKCANILGDKVLEQLNSEIIAEFPITEPLEFENFWNERNYILPKNSHWSIDQS
mgnify:CR=1 FL=1